jgi:hypothetical protein
MGSSREVVLVQIILVGFIIVLQSDLAASAVSFIQKYFFLKNIKFLEKKCNKNAFTNSFDARQKEFSKIFENME